MARDAFALPPPSPGTRKAIAAARRYIYQRIEQRADARTVLKGMAAEHGAKISYPSYRTALRCAGIYTEAATGCDLATAKLLLASFLEKASRYLSQTAPGDLFDAEPVRDYSPGTMKEAKNHE